jgi:hypothetical protein
MTVTSSNGLVFTPNFSSETTMGSSLYSTKAYTISLHPSFLFGRLKIFIFFFFLIAHFLLVENTYKNHYSLKAFNITITEKIIALNN